MSYEKKFEGKTILITGGLGFIGSNLAIALVNLQPKKIIIVDSLVESLGGSLENIKEIKNNPLVQVISGEKGNLQNINEMKHFIQEADYIFNLAGSPKHTPFNEKEMAFDTDVNFVAQLHFLEAVRQVMVENKQKSLSVVFAGTRDQYGKVSQKELPIVEEYLPKTMTDYQSISKQAIESHHIVLNNSLREQNYGIKINSLRVTNTYGPKQSPQHAVIPVFIEKATSNQTIELWGGGEVYRDINYIDDVIDAFLLVATSEKNGQAYNLGCCIGKSGLEQPIGNNFLSIKSLAELIVKIAGKGAIKIIPYPPERKAVEPGHFCADITKINQELGWLPKTSIEEGIQKTIALYQKSKTIPAFDIKRQHESLKQELHEVSSRVIFKNCFFILGEEKKLFEQEFAAFCNRKFGIGLNSGTDALFLALKALNIQKGDEVIVPTNTAVPTIMAIEAAHAKPVLVDVNEDYLINVEEIEKKITPNTKVIMPVHLYGNPCDMDSIIAIAQKYNLKIIEDCCQAHGAEYKGKKVPFTDIGCFSFYPTKNLGALGDAGMVITDDEQLKNKLVLLRNYGQENRYHATIHGINSRLDELQAAFLRVKLKNLDSFNEKRKKLALLYNQLLYSLPIKIPQLHQGHVSHLYVIRTDKRDELMNYLKEKNIFTQIHYPIPIHMQKAFSYLNHREGDFPKAEKFAQEIISLPMYPELTEEEVKTVCREIGNFFRI
ncbi:MAG: hypothetical protein RL557_222 [archaeon]